MDQGVISLVVRSTKNSTDVQYKGVKYPVVPIKKGVRGLGKCRGGGRKFVSVLSFGCCCFLFRVLKTRKPLHTESTWREIGRDSGSRYPEDLNGDITTL